MEKIYLIFVPVLSIENGVEISIYFGEDLCSNVNSTTKELCHLGQIT